MALITATVRVLISMVVPTAAVVIAIIVVVDYLILYKTGSNPDNQQSQQ